MICPLMYRLHGMAKKATAAAISVTSAARPNGVLFSAFLNEFAFAFNAYANISVLVTQGATQFDRTCGAHSHASVFVSCAKAALLAA